MVEFVVVPASNGRYHVFYVEGRLVRFLGVADRGEYVYGTDTVPGFAADSGPHFTYSGLGYLPKPDRRGVETYDLGRLVFEDRSHTDEEPVIHWAPRKD